MSQAASSSRPGASPMPRPPGPSNITTILDSQAGRILCIADIRGRLGHLNALAKEHNAKAIIHTGDFGFYEITSLARINDRTLRHLVTYSPLLTGPQKPHLTANDTPPAQLRQTLQSSNLELLTEFPKLLAGELKFQVPVYTVYGACEDFQILEKFRMGIYEVENLHVLDEATTRCIDIGGIKLRLLGLGGALVPHKLFDNGDGQATIAGGQGTMWTTALQIGELVDTAQRVYDETETRMLITHASPGRESILTQLAVITKADLTISGGLHFRYATSYNEFSVQYDMEGFRNKLIKGKDSIEKVWESVKAQVEGAVDDQQRILLEKFLSVLERVPTAPTTGPNAVNVAEEPFWKNCWNWNLCDAAYGCLVLDINSGRVSADLKSQGFNYAYRRTGVAPPQPASNTVAAPKTPAPPSSAATPAPPAPAVNAVPKTPVTSEPKTPISEATSPAVSKDRELQGNGHAAANERAEQRKKERKEKEKEKRERLRAEKEKEKQQQTEKAATSPNAETVATGATAKAPPTPKGSGKATPDPSPSTAADSSAPAKPFSNEADPTSPILSGAESSGAQTPTSRRPARNPWTLFIKLPAPVSEQELRDFFLEAKEGITKVNMPPSNFGRGRVAYVEFGDEEAMKEGLTNHAEKLKDAVINVTVAEQRPHNPGFRGRGRGGFAQRNFAAAGLTHRKYSGAGGSSDKKADPKPAVPTS